jgi:hypothetical protein
MTHTQESPELPGRFTLSSSSETPMTDRPSMPQETVATRRLPCRRQGAALHREPRSRFRHPRRDRQHAWAERETLRLPGLSDPEAAYEVGRALRMIGHILDSQISPVEHGRHFLSELANAVLSFALRGERQPWGAEDTAFVFRETFKAAPTDAQKASDAILAYVRKRPIVKTR